jgi:hypothetical protein
MEASSLTSTRYSHLIQKSKGVYHATNEVKDGALVSFKLGRKNGRMGFAVMAAVSSHGEEPAFSRMTRDERYLIAVNVSCGFVPANESTIPLRWSCTMRGERCRKRRSWTCQDQMGRLLLPTLIIYHNILRSRSSMSLI